MLPGYSDGKLPGRSTKEKSREEGELDEYSEKREIRKEIAQVVVAGIKEKASMHDGDKEVVQTTSWEKFHAKLGLLTN